MKKAIRLHQIGWVGLAMVTITSGCTHNYYYGTTAGCPPLGQPVTTQMGQVCDVPSGTIVTSNAAPIVVGQADTNPQTITAPPTQRVVISQPAPSSSLGNRLGWRPRPPESPATTRVTGALDDSPYK